METTGRGCISIKLYLQKQSRPLADPCFRMLLPLDPDFVFQKLPLLDENMSNKLDLSDLF